MATIPIRDIPTTITNPSGTDLVVLDNGVSMGKATVSNVVDARAPALITDAINGLNLGTASQQNVEAFATSAQGAKADTAVQSVNGKSGTNVTLGKADVGLGNIDNTSDLNKPISNATQTALNSKASADQGARADTALQAPGGATGQVLTKASGATNDVSWADIEAATAVSYGPQTLSPAQQEQARSNISAMPASAATKASIVDADAIAITDSAASGAPKRVLWSVVKAALAVIHYTKTEVNSLLAGNMAGRAYPRRADGAALNFNGTGVASGQPPALIGGGWDGNFSNFYFYTTASLSVAWAAGAGYADRLGSGGWTLAQVQDQLNWRLTDSRFAGYIEQNFVIPETGSFSNIVPGAPGYVVCGIWTWAPGRNLAVSFRQPQMYLPNAGGWRPLGTW